jgi:hypothetical protein
MTWFHGVMPQCRRHKNMSQCHGVVWFAGCTMLGYMWSSYSKLVHHYDLILHSGMDHYVVLSRSHYILVLSAYSFVMLSWCQDVMLPLRSVAPMWG